MKIHVKMLTAMLAIILQGCGRDRSCGDIRSLVEVESNRSELLRWADENVFSRKFYWKKKDFNPLSSYTGPGRHGVMINMDVVGLRMPDAFSDYYLWSIGPDETMPDAIFVGKKGVNFKGIVVTKGELHKSLRGEGDLIKYIESKHSRIGVLCVNRD
jgi:hypothetical protein